ncbi:hypothetical protein ACLOJK_025667 [Asimina triloba]
MVLYCSVLQNRVGSGIRRRSVRRIGLGLVDFEKSKRRRFIKSNGDGFRFGAVGKGNISKIRKQLLFDIGGISSSLVFAHLSLLFCLHRFLCMILSEI